MAKNGSVMHRGDNRTGDGDGDDETIDIYLNKMAAEVDSIWPIITVYTTDR